MDIVPILSTIILVATVITLIVAISSYMVFRIKEKRREMRAQAGFSNKPKVEETKSTEDTRSEESTTSEPLHDDRESRDNRQLQNTEEIPSGVERRQDNRQDDRVSGSSKADAREADRRIREQPELIPLPGDNRRMLERRAEQIAYDRYMESLDRSRVMSPQPVSPPLSAREQRDMISSERFTESQVQPPALQDAEEPESEDEVELSGAQAAFMSSLNLSKKDMQLPDSGRRAGGKHTSGADKLGSNGTVKLRRFTVPGGGAGKKGPSEFNDEKVEWK